MRILFRLPIRFSISYKLLVFKVSFAGKEIGERVWDQKVLIKLKGKVKPSKSLPAGQRRRSQWSCSQDSNSTQLEYCNVISEALFQ